MHLSYFDQDLIDRIRFAEPDAEILVESDGEREQAKVLIAYYRRPDLRIRFERREEYDGDRFILDLDY